MIDHGEAEVVGKPRGIYRVENIFESLDILHVERIGGSDRATHPVADNRIVFSDSFEVPNVSPTRTDKVVDDDLKPIAGGAASEELVEVAVPKPDATSKRGEIKIRHGLAVLVRSPGVFRNKKGRLQVRSRPLCTIASVDLDRIIEW